jgi:hypothetical protein
MNKDNKDVRIFTPYYINQSRLFDLYSILNGGFVEYEEISSLSTINTKGTGKAEIGTSGGFKLIKISGGGEAGLERAKENSSASTTRKIQTVTSILGTVLESMEEKGHFKEINLVSQGEFINTPVNFTLNSVKKLFEMLKEIAELSSSFKALGSNLKLPYTTKQVDDIIKVFKFLIDTLEVYYETDEYAIIANITENNLYLSNVDDVVGTDITCFAQVKKIYPDGCPLLRNTILSKMKGSNKSSIIGSFSGFTGNESFDLGVSARSKICGKTVYEVEIISLCK